MAAGFDVQLSAQLRSRFSEAKDRLFQALTAAGFFAMAFPVEAPRGKSLTLALVAVYETAGPQFCEAFPQFPLVVLHRGIHELGGDYMDLPAPTAASLECRRAIRPYFALFRAAI